MGDKSKDKTKGKQDGGQAGAMGDQPTPPTTPPLAGVGATAWQARKPRHTKARPKGIWLAFRLEQKNGAYELAAAHSGVRCRESPIFPLVGS